MTGRAAPPAPAPLARHVRPGPRRPPRAAPPLRPPPRPPPPPGYPPPPLASPHLSPIDRVRRVRRIRRSRRPPRRMPPAPAGSAALHRPHRPHRPHPLNPDRPHRPPRPIAPPTVRRDPPRPRLSRPAALDLPTFRRCHRACRHTASSAPAPRSRPAPSSGPERKGQACGGRGRARLRPQALHQLLRTRPRAPPPARRARRRCASRRTRERRRAGPPRPAPASAASPPASRRGPAPPAGATTPRLGRAPLALAGGGQALHGAGVGGGQPGALALGPTLELGGVGHEEAVQEGPAVQPRRPLQPPPSTCASNSSTSLRTTSRSSPTSSPAETNASAPSSLRSTYSDSERRWRAPEAVCSGQRSPKILSRPTVRPRARARMASSATRRRRCAALPSTGPLRPWKAAPPNRLRLNMKERWGRREGPFEGRWMIWTQR